MPVVISAHIHLKSSANDSRVADLITLGHF